MWNLAYYALAIGAGAIGEWWFRRLRGRLQFWQDVAASCGLSEVESSSAWNLQLVLKAQAGLAGAWIGHNGRKTRVWIRVPGPPGFKELRISREPSKPASREIEVGDEPFDRMFFVEGPVRLACALLDAETRRLLLSLNAESDLALTGEQLQAEMSDGQLPRILPLLLDLGRRFARPPDVAQSLADNALRDSAAGVRLQNLLLLLRAFPGEPATLEVLRAACSDASPEIRLRAAMELGAEGRDVLLALAENTEDDGCSAQAIRIVAEDLPFERTRAILAQALRRRRKQTAHACLEALGRSGTAEAVAVLAKVMAREKGDLTITAAQALGATGNPAAEPPLIRALQREQPDLRMAAAQALGRVGSTAAVLPLKEAAERFSQNPELVRATRQAIAEIQSRLPGASPGQLSLAGAEAGQLSLAQAEAGQLSLAMDQGGQLSLAPGEPGQLSLSDDEEELKPAPGGAA